LSDPATRKLPDRENAIHVGGNGASATHASRC
jgi:hypothetical protein